MRAMSHETFEPPPGSREERIAYNEAWSRTLNEHKANLAGGRDLMAGFRCECWQAACTERIPMSSDDWKLARAKPNRFAVVPDHVAEHLEAVIEAFPHSWLVEKFGEAGAVAEKLASPDLRLPALPSMQRAQALGAVGLRKRPRLTSAGVRGLVAAEEGGARRRSPDRYP